MADNSFYRVLVLHEYRHGLQFFFHRNDQRRTELCRIRTISRRLSLYVRHKKAGMLSPRSWLNTLSLMGLALFINLPLTLFFSYLIYKKVAGHAVLRVGMYVPCVLSTVILCLFYKISVSGTQTYKSLFTILEKLGYGNRFVIENGALADSRTAWKAILIFSVWAGVNGNIIYFTSSMARLQIGRASCRERVSVQV